MSDEVIRFIWISRLLGDVGVGWQLVVWALGCMCYLGGATREKPTTEIKAVIGTTISAVYVATWLLWARGYVTGLMVTP